MSSQLLKSQSDLSLEVFAMRRKLHAVVCFLFLLCDLSLEVFAMRRKLHAFVLGTNGPQDGSRGEGYRLSLELTRASERSLKKRDGMIDS